MKKVLVIGCPGSGKSTFSRALHKATGLPLYHLDMLNWNADRTTVPRQVFLERLNHVIQEDSWIIDGNYGSTMELRMDACDTVFFLDYPVEVCLDGVMCRKGQPRSDMPWIETGTDEDFLQFIRKYNSVSRPVVLELLQKYAGKSIFVFSCRSEAEIYLTQLLMIPSTKELF